jgi:hypothetical protein
MAPRKAKAPRERGGSGGETSSKGSGRLTESLRGRVCYIERQSREPIAAQCLRLPRGRVILDDSLAVMVEPNADGLADGILRGLKDRELVPGPDPSP